MKKFENLGKLLSKEEQKQILGGDPPGGCLPEFTTGCSISNDDCCAPSKCEMNATNSGTICVER